MAYCNSCEAEIIWAETVNAKRMPLDAKPTSKGTMVFISGKTRLASDEDRQLLRPMYTSHFATCPNAEAHRKK